MTLFLCIGLLGAIIMFSGDMLYYYNKNNKCKTDGDLQLIVNVMKKKSNTKLYAGGILGSFSAFFYCLGYYHTVLFIEDERYQIIGWICFLVNSLGIICGGTYHSHFAYLGLLGKYDNNEVLGEVLRYMNTQKKIAFTISGVGFTMQAILILFGLTIFPRWMFFVSPLFLVCLTPLMKKLPQELYTIICGGWTNLISIIYYTVAIIICLM